MSQILQNKCCSNTAAAYHIKYENNSKSWEADVCESCFHKEIKSKNYPDTLIKPYQRDAVQITCITCNSDVTKTVGCESCHPVSKEESN